MMDPSQREVTQFLLQWRDGDAEAFEHLMPLVYEELRRLAHRHLWNERDDHTLHTTDLVHEAYLNLIAQEQTPWQGRAHFFAVAARAMRHILIDYARRRNRVKRGGGQYNLSLDDVAVFTEDQYEDLIALDQALTGLEAVDPRLCQVVECRYFGGLTIAETAEALDISPATVKRDWHMAKAWLRRELFERGS
jgi:RNA polymerase sigma factor (TIGR02999 family)